MFKISTYVIDGFVKFFLFFPMLFYFTQTKKKKMRCMKFLLFPLSDVLLI